MDSNDVLAVVLFLLLVVPLAFALVNLLPLPGKGRLSLRAIRLSPSRFAALACFMAFLWFVVGFDSPHSDAEAHAHRLAFAFTMAVMVLGGLEYRSGPTPER